jgi:TPR repeat protein
MALLCQRWVQVEWARRVRLIVRRLKNALGVRDSDFRTFAFFMSGEILVRVSLLGVWCPRLGGCMNGEPKDLSALRKKAEQGDAQAQFELGLCYCNGRGVPQDDKEGVKWFRLAAEQGNAKGQLILGLFYSDGRGVSQDDKESVKWYRLAAEQGNAGAQRILGSCYFFGTGVPMDNKESVKWYRLAAEQGGAVEQCALAGQYDIFGDYNEAAKWYRLAAEQGNAQAQFDLGLYYCNGQGVPQDYVKAYVWFNIAATQGHKAAETARSKGLEIMTPAQIEEGQRLSREYAEKFMKK